MLTVKEAVRAAESWVRDLYAGGALDQLRLEEVEITDDDRSWLITLGWREPGVKMPAVLAPVLGDEVPVHPRTYKTLEVDTETGAVRSMKIREVS